MKLAVTTAISVTLCTALLGAGAAQASTKSTPGGTLLLPLTPKLDDSSGNSSSSIFSPSLPIAPALAPNPKPQPAPAAQKSDSNKKKVAGTSAPTPGGAIRTSAPKAANTPAAAGNTGVPGAQNAQNAPAAQNALTDTPITPTADAALPATDGDTKLKPTPDHIAAESGPADDMSTAEIIDENTQLKGTVQIVADDTEYDQEKNTFLGTGNAVAIIAGQNSKLEADTILFDQNTQMIDARGNVKILRQGQLTTGSSFKFKVNSDEYLITDPDTEVQGTTVVARQAYGTKTGLAFKNGTVSIPEPFHIHKNEFFGPISNIEDTIEKDVHPDAYLPAKPSYRFTARKMTYEKYKEAGNMTITGGRLLFGNFSVPLPKFVATVGQENNRVVFPVTPFFANNLNVGGVNAGPMFNTAVGKEGIFSWAPLVQWGGTPIGGVVDSTKSKLGAGFRLRYATKRLQTQIAYGSVSNILVAELKYQVRPGVLFQSGINRFMPDGMFGIRRPRAIAEVVANKTISGVPFLSMLDFRTSGGFMQDQPALLSLTPQFGKLFTNDTSTVIKSGYRLQQQVMFQTHPILAVGDDKYGAKVSLFGGAALKAYSSGDALGLAQAGPTLQASLHRVHFNTGYTQSVVRGQSPFVFDQFIQGQRSCFLSGDVKLSKWLTLGGNLAYNLNNKMLLGRTVTAAIGPDDFKLILSRDTIRGMNRFGFDVLYGAPIPYSKLVLKGSPDTGQMGSGI